MTDWINDLGFGFEQADWFLRLLLALAAGVILGLDREIRGRRVGVRTYMMVSLGAAIFTIVNIEMSFDLQASVLSAYPRANGRAQRGQSGPVGQAPPRLKL